MELPFLVGLIESAVDALHTRMVRVDVYVLNARPVESACLQGREGALKAGKSVCNILEVGRPYKVGMNLRKSLREGGTEMISSFSSLRLLVNKL